MAHSERIRYGSCELCGHEKSLSFHHLIPRKVHRRKYFQKRYDKYFMHTYGINVCKHCHSHIHKYISEMDLAKYYNTLEKLNAHPELKKYVNWAKSRKKV